MLSHFFKEKRKRQRRIVLNKNTAVYHVVSKTAYHEFRFSTLHKETFREMLERQAVFCGIEILAFCLLDNHFHLLLRVPYSEHPPSDETLLLRYKALYAGRPVPKSALTIEEVAFILKEGGSAAKKLRKQLIARMGNVSMFVKELKQRFSIWYNNHFDNVGTIWCEPFKSVLVEDLPNVLKLVSAYIDLNPVRAGICESPEDYPFSSIGEASRGSSFARKGLLNIYLSKNWRSTYQKHLYLLSKDQPLKPGKGLANNDMHELLGTGSNTPIGLLMRQRLPVFSEGGIIGHVDFVKQIESFLQQRHAFKKRFKPKPLYAEKSSCQFHSLYLLPIPLTY